MNPFHLETGYLSVWRIKNIISLITSPPPLFSLLESQLYMCSLLKQVFQHSLIFFFNLCSLIFLFVFLPYFVGQFLSFYFCYQLFIPRTICFPNIPPLFWNLFNFYFLDALILLSVRSVVLLLHSLLSTSLFYPSCFSRELLLFFWITHDKCFFRGLFSLLVGHGSELIGSSEQDRGACQLWPSRYGNVDGLFIGETPVSHVSIFLSPRMFGLPRKESFRLWQARKCSKASTTKGQFRRWLRVGALRIWNSKSHSIFFFIYSQMGLEVSPFSPEIKLKFLSLWGSKHLSNSLWCSSAQR